MMLQKWKALSLVLAMAVIFSACGAQTGKTVSKGLDPNEKVTLKITYFNEQAFYQTYGNVFQALYPNIEFEIVQTGGNLFGQDGDPVADLQSIIDGQKPDIVLLNAGQYESMAASGQLTDLDLLIKADNFDIENLYQGVIDLLKAKAGGKLYGLAPNFSSKAIYYNKDLFDKYHVDYPKDQMSWEQILKLAARFPSDGTGDNKIYGLYPSQFSRNPFDLVISIGSTNGLSYVDYENGKLTIDNEAWKKVFQQVVDSLKSGTLYQQPASNGGGNGGGNGGVRIGRGFANNSLFLSGRAAMSFDNSTFVNMSQFVRNIDQDAQTINWAVVTAPVDPANPEGTSELAINQIFAISSQSANQAAAWEFVKYVNGAAAAKMNAKTSQNLQTRTAYISDNEDRNLAAFYKLKPNDVSLLQKFPAGFSSAFNTITTQAINDVLSGVQTVEEALHAIQSKGQDELTALMLAEQNE